MYEVIIVGTGASGVASALELSEHKIKSLIVDVGYTANEIIKDPKNLYEMKKERDCSDFLIGEKFRYFNEEKQKLPVKLKSPYFDFVTKKVDFFQIEQRNYNAITSFAKGGLANAWGNGLMRLSREEFKDLPIELDDLLPFYKKLESEIGISGRNDDLVRFFGESDNLQEPLIRSYKAEKIYTKYLKNKNKLNKQNIYLGTPRIGVSDNFYNGREVCQYDNLEFWQPNHKSLYTPAVTLNKLIEKGLVEYKNGIFVDSWIKEKGYILLKAYDNISKKEICFKTKKLILAAGPLNTSRIVLKSKNDYNTNLNFLDNPAIQIPLFFPSMIGSKFETDSFGMGQLNLFYKSKILDKNIIGAILELTSPLRNEFLNKFPFSIKKNIDSIKNILPAMMAIQIFLPSDSKINAKLSLQKNGSILLDGSSQQIDDNLVDEAIKVLRALGLLTHRGFAVKVSHGNGIHYGGTLPMKKSPSSEFHTTINGELFKEEGVFIVDGSILEVIPSTNYSLTIMANSMRIVNNIIKGLM